MNARTDVEHNYKISGDFNAALNVKPSFILRLIVSTVKFRLIFMPD
jgi:transcriptional regulator of NAD metabolism